MENTSVNVLHIYSLGRILGDDMVRKCREIEIVIKDGNFIHTTHDYLGETCEELKNIILKFIDARSLNFRYTDDRDDPRGPHKDRHSQNEDDDKSDVVN